MPPLFLGQPVTRFHVMAKPVGPRCNLNCTYCFYLHKQSLLKTSGTSLLSDDLLETFIRQYMTRQNCGEIIFTWQGGEPLLAGLDFFRRIVALQKKFAPEGVRIENDFQTNGTLLDDDWCSFLAENRFWVGLSVDGPRAIHNRCRTNTAGDGSFEAVLRAAHLLKKHGIAFNTLSCIHRWNVDRPLDVYRFLVRELGSSRIQLIPIVETRSFHQTPPQFWKPEEMPVLHDPRTHPDHPESIVHPWTVPAEDWGRFLARVFDDWLRRDIGKVGVFYFESALKQFMGQFADLCTLAPICGKAMAMEHDGSVYSCDHYVYPEYRLGNIQNTPLDVLAFSRRQEAFGLNKENALPAYCRSCAYLNLCNGECPKNRFLRTPDGEAGLNYLCAGWKQYFAHILPYLKDWMTARPPSRH